MSRHGQVSEGFLPMSWSCASTHSLNLYCDGKTEWPLILNTSSTSRVLWRTQSPASCSPQTPTRFSQKEAVSIWAPRGLGKRLEPWFPTDALQTLTPAASVCCFTSWLGMFAFLRHMQGGVCLLSSCKIQLPKICNQLWSSPAFSEIRNISDNF